MTHHHTILNTTTWSGALMSCFAAMRDGMSDLTLNDWIAIIGVSMAVFGALTNFVFKLRADRRERIEHQARLSS
ncbi:MAG: hypothetical protein HRT62_20275 [Epibacterium sp.]|nr:hypothetical protein [Epibacterium sp.]